jgi:hypothetical protein
MGLKKKSKKIAKKKAKKNKRKNPQVAAPPWQS